MAKAPDKMRAGSLETGVATGGGLLVGARAVSKSHLRSDDAFVPDAWIRIGRDGTATVIIDRSEMGQGVTTSLAMLVAEELEIDLEHVHTEFAPADPAYSNPRLGEQMTGGSTSVRAAWKPLRQAGAAAREMLISAAARTWGVKKTACRAEHGRVLHVPTGRSLSYGELADKAASLRAPKAVPLKTHDEFRLIGKPTPRLEIPDMVTGRAVYSIDVTVPGMLVATVLRCPIIGGAVAEFDANRALAVNGVRHVIEIDSGIAVVADNFWSALKGREVLTVKWNEGPYARLSSTAIKQRFEQAAQRSGKVARKQGNVKRALKRATRIIEAVYETPYLAHAPMEPVNCTAHVRADGCDVWVGTQAQTGVQETAARITGLSRDAIKVHTTFLGGGFGRRLEQDFVTEAVQISKRVGAPVQVLWTRQDDMKHGCYRPANYTVLQGALDSGGMPIAWFERVVGPPIALEDVDIPYEIPHIREEHVEEDPGVPCGYWRSVSASQNAFAVEGFIDELAHAGGKDPFEYRRVLLANAPRYRAVLELAGTKAGWGKPPPDGRYQGIALYHSFGSWVAEVAEVSVSAQHQIKVHRVVCAVDCGTTVNPDTVIAQIEGAVVFGLGAVLKHEITIEDGRVQQGTFEDYPLITLAEMPPVEVHIMPSRRTPGGVGEPGVPPIAPAVANAVFAATGHRIRALPLRLPAWCA